MLACSKHEQFDRPAPRILCSSKSFVTIKAAHTCIWMNGLGDQVWHGTWAIDSLMNASSWNSWSLMNCDARWMIECSALICCTSSSPSQTSTLPIHRTGCSNCSNSDSDTSVSRHLRITVHSHHLVAYFRGHHELRPLKGSVLNPKHNDVCICKQARCAVSSLCPVI